LPAELDRIFDRFRSGSQFGGARGHWPGPGPGAGGRPRARRRGAGAQRPGRGQRVRAGAAGTPGARAAAAVPGTELLGTPDAGRAVPSDALGAGSRPAYGPADPGPPGAERTTVEEL